jgi:hypothetical protein
LEKAGRKRRFFSPVHHSALLYNTGRVTQFSSAISPFGRILDFMPVMKGCKDFFVCHYR